MLCITRETTLLYALLLKMHPITRFKPWSHKHLQMRAMATWNNDHEHSSKQPLVVLAMAARYDDCIVIRSWHIRDCIMNMLWYDHDLVIYHLVSFQLLGVFLWLLYTIMIVWWYHHKMIMIWSWYDHAILIIINSIVPGNTCSLFELKNLWFYFNQIS